MRDNQLWLREMEFVDRATIVYHFEVSGAIEKYLSLKKFYIRYDNPVTKIDKSILTIPFISGVLTTSWLSGTDILIDTLDENYFNSLINVKKIYNRFYPEIGFNSNIVVDELVDNKFKEKGMGVLFSGGLDSTSLYIQNRERKPTLFMILGGVVPIHNKPMLKKLKQIYSKFAEKEGVKIHFIESDIRKVLNESLLMAKYGKYLKSYILARSHNTWWEGVNHGLIQLCFIAPLTVKKINNLKIAASRGLGAHGSNFYLVKSLGWSSLKVIPEGSLYNRNEKIKQVIKPFITQNSVYPTIQSCNYAPVVSEQINCGSCQKCTMMILELLLEEIDPRKCGFPIIQNFYVNIRDKVLKEITSTKKWVHIQNDVKSGSYYVLSNDFVTWFKEFDFSRVKPESTLNLGAKCMFLYFYSKLPHEVQKRIIKKLYHHQHVKKREQIKYAPLTN